MSKISRREFIKLGLATGAGFLLGPVTRSLRAFAAASPAPAKALFWIKAPGTDIRCQLCPRKCLIKQGGRGFCEVRENRGGQLFTMAYGNPCAVHTDPIEKKPLYHVLPGTRTLSFATAGCNFECRYCQNWQISQARPEQTENTELSPQQAVALALGQQLPSVSATYTEPTVFYEDMHDTFRLAREKGLATLYHSNGFINPEPLKGLCRYLTAANIDLKAFDDDTYARMSQGLLAPVLDTLKTLQAQGVWTEITHLLVPGWNDQEDRIKALCQWIVKNLGPDVPLHFSRFYPSYKLAELAPTPIETLRMAKRSADDAGMHYVYLGNIPGEEGSGTICPKCKKTVIARSAFEVTASHLKDGKCGYCGHLIPGVWQL